MITITKIEDMQKYYNIYTNTYEFIEDGKRLDVVFNTDIYVNASIVARDIIGRDINAHNITASDVDAHRIGAWDIKVFDLVAWNVNARTISAVKISAECITYYAVAFAYSSFKCKSIEGTRDNSKHFCLDNDVEVG